MKTLDAIHWEDVYLPYLSKVKVRGDQLTSLCPFHEDRHASFSVNLSKGLYNCFACGVKGNGVQFLSEMKGITKEEAYTELSKEEGHMPSSYTIEDYAREKGLPLDFLKACGVKDSRYKSCITITYYNEDKSWRRPRLRYAKTSQPRFRWGKGERMEPYGLWKLAKIREQGYVILVEGESDTQTLWYSGLAAMGIPGASSFKSEWSNYFKEVGTIYLYQEPDQGGDTFVEKMLSTLNTYCPTSTIYVIQNTGYKDISEFYMAHDQDKDQTRAWVNACMAKAIKHTPSLIDQPSNSVSGFLDELGLGHLQLPPNYLLNEDGVWHTDEEGQMKRCICRVPIVIGARVQTVDLGEEKVEVCFKRDGQWRKVCYKRSLLFHHTNIVELADYGITLTSASAKHLVQYLYEFENVNIHQLPIKKMVQRLGWHGKEFLPYGAQEMELDPSNQSAMWQSAYTTKGDYEVWRAFTQEMREQSFILRAYIAAACGTPFLQALGQRIFYLYNWAETEGGKTACLSLAMSVWGDPSQLVQTYNSTSVGLEYTASYMNDLPLALNERQAAGKDQSKLETDAYRLSEGKGRLRGNKQGGIQHRGAWRTILLCNGEEPFITEQTMSGVATRTLEIVGKPYQTDADARATYDLINEHYGLLGQLLVEKIVDPEKFAIITQQLKQLKQVIEEGLRRDYSQYRSTNIAAISFISAVDIWLTIQFFEPGCDHNVAIEKGFNMAKSILTQQASREESDIVEKMYLRTRDWLGIQHNKFIIKDRVHQEPQGEIYGMIEHCGIETTYYVYPKVFEDFCTQQKQSYTQIIKGFADRGYIDCIKEGNTRRTSVKRRINGTPCRVIAFTLKDEVAQQTRLTS